MAGIAFHGVTKRYGRTAALAGVDLMVDAGAFCAIVGASGCGKTTLLRIAAGFVAADAGRVAIDGTDIGGLPPNRRDVGFVFQSYALFPTKTVAQNIGFAPRLRRWPRAETAERVRELCRLVGLDGLEARFPHELSGGQQQRVALARALAPRPSILLLDEPLSALDARIRAHLRTEIRGIVDALGVTALYVTHDQEEALAIADRIAVMHEGRLLQHGPPSEVYLKPACRTVAGFIGVANALPARATGNGAVRIGDVTLPVAGAPALADGTPVQLHFRPEHATADSGDGPGLPGTVAGAAFLGPVARLTIRLADDSPAIADLPASHWIEAPLAPGTKVRLTVDPRFALVFPAGADEA